MTRPRASVVIATYGKAEYLRLTLDSLAAQSVRDFEVVVVDDGTLGGIAAAVDSPRPPLDLRVVVSGNRGRAAARNLGVEASTGDAIVFCDDDRIASPGFVEEHLRNAECGDAATIGWKRRVLTHWKPGALPLSESELLQVVELFGRDLAAMRQPAVCRLDLGDEPDNYHAIVDRYGGELRDFRLGWALGTTANMVVPRRALMDVGGFDEGFTGWGAEDTELCYRLHRHGLRFRVSRGAVNSHQVHPLPDAGHPGAVHLQRQQLMRNLDYFCRKHPVLEVFLFRRRWQYGVTLIEANEMLSVLDADDSRLVRAELERAYGLV